MKPPIIDGSHRRNFDLRSEMVVAEAVKTMSIPMLFELFKDAVTRTRETKNIGSIKVAVYTGRELARRGYNEGRFPQYLALVEHAVTEAEKITGTKLF